MLPGPDVRQDVPAHVRRGARARPAACWSRSTARTTSRATSWRLQPLGPDRRRSAAGPAPRAGRRAAPGIARAARGGGGGRRARRHRAAERRQRGWRRRPGGDARRPPPERTTTEPKKQKPAPPKRVTLRIVPVERDYVCVDRGAGTPVVFEGTIDTAQTFRGQARAREPGQDATCGARRTASRPDHARSATRSGSPSPDAHARAAGPHGPASRSR